MVDRETLQVYADRADDYADRFKSDRPDRHLQSFMDALPEGGRVLDLGCGPGHSAAHMVAAGYNVDAWDASPELAAIGADQHGLSIEVRTFATLGATEEYNGIYANFSLLHAPRTDMPDHLASIARALKPSGVFHIGLKTGEGEKRDRLGRYYTYYTDEELTGLFQSVGFQIISRETGAEAGLEGSVDPWIVLQAKKQ